MMKKLLFTIATGAFLTTGAMAQYVNMDLETWTGVNPGIQCDEWGTLNAFTGFGAPQTTFQETADPGEGLSSAMIVTDYWLGATGAGAASDTVSGFLTLGGPPPGVLGVPLAQKPTSVDFWAKWNMQPGDTGAVLVQLSHWDTVLDTQIVDAQALIPFPDSMDTWTAFTATPFYFTTDTPDTLQIICVSSMGSLLGGMPLPIIGSKLWVDGFVINGITGVGELDEDVKFTVYPNPASDYVVIKNGSSNSTIDVVMYDINGKIVRSYYKVSGGELTINRNGLASGSYMITVTSGGKQMMRNIVFN